MATSSFGTTPITFYPIAGGDARVTVQPGQLQYSIRHIPYSNYDVLDLGGQSAPILGPLDIRVDPDDAVGFEALYGISAALTLHSVVYSRATLINLSNKRVTPRGEWMLYSATWVVG